MRESKRTKTQPVPGSDEWLKHSIQKTGALEFVLGIITLAITILSTLLSLFVTSKSGSGGRNGIHLTTNLLYFVGGVFLLGIITLAVAYAIRRRNRDVINL